MIRRQLPMILSAIMMLGLAGGAAAADVDVTYTDLDPDAHCDWDSLDHLTEEEREQMLGNSAVCDGLPGYPVHFSEYDLRQFLAFGPVGPDDRTPGGFGEFNRTGDKIEWRSRRGRPYATILRWYIENQGDGGMPDRRSEGQVLVISTVAQPANPHSCPAGFVDARANKDANEIARKVADTVAAGFRCGIDRPLYHGKVGKFAGTPNVRFD